MGGADRNPKQINPEFISAVLDTVAVTTRTLNYIDESERLGITEWLPDLSIGIEVLRKEAYTTIDDCNEFIHAIGGIPVRTSLETEARIIGFTGFSEGVWTFKCTSPTAGEELMSGSAQRLREVYSATLPDEPSDTDLG